MSEDTASFSKDTRQKNLVSFLESVLTNPQHAFKPQECSAIIPMILRRQRTSLKKYFDNGEIANIYSMMQEEEEFKDYFNPCQAGNKEISQDVVHIFCERLGINHELQSDFSSTLRSKNYLEAQKTLTEEQKALFKELLIQYDISQSQSQSLHSEQLAKQQSETTRKQSISNLSQKSLQPHGAPFQHFLTHESNTDIKSVLYLMYIGQLLALFQFSQNEMSHSLEIPLVDQKVVEVQKTQNLSIKLEKVTVDGVQRIRTVCKKDYYSLTVVRDLKVNPQNTLFTRGKQYLNDAIKLCFCLCLIFHIMNTLAKLVDSYSQKLDSIINVLTIIMILALLTKLTLFLKRLLINQLLIRYFSDFLLYLTQSFPDPSKTPMRSYSLTLKPFEELLEVHFQNSSMLEGRLPGITHTKEEKLEANFGQDVTLCSQTAFDFMIVNTKSDLFSETLQKLKAKKQQLPTLSETQNPQFWLVIDESHSPDLLSKGNKRIMLEDSFDFKDPRCSSCALDAKFLNSESASILGQYSFEKMTLKLQSNTIHKIWLKQYRLNSEIKDEMEEIEKIEQSVERNPDWHINQWRNRHIDDLCIAKDELMNQFRANKKRNDQIEKQFLEKIREFEQSFVHYFSQKSDWDLSKEIIEIKRKVISEQFDYICKRLKHDMEDYEMKRKIKDEEQEGNTGIKTLINKINVQQSEKTMTEKEKAQNFDKVYNEILEKLSKSIDQQKLAKDRYSRVEEFYESRIKQCSLSTSLNSKRIVLTPIEPIVNCSYKQYKDILLSDFNKQKNGDMTFSSSSLPHTDVLAGGRTDASLKYFNMNDYFERVEKTSHITLSKQQFDSAFKYQDFFCYVRKEYMSQKRSHVRVIIQEIVKQISRCLILLNLSFESQQQIITLIQRILDQIEAKSFEGVLNKPSDFFSSSWSDMFQFPTLVYADSFKQSTLFQSKYINHAQLQQLILNKRQNPETAVIHNLCSELIKNVININLIYQQVNSHVQILKIKKRCIERFSREIEKEFSFFGFKMDVNAYVKQIIQIPGVRRDHFSYIDTEQSSFSTFDSSQSFKKQLRSLLWFNESLISKQYREMKILQKDELSIGTFKTFHIQPLQYHGNFQMKNYINEHKKEVSHYLEREETQVFLWQQLHARGSFTLLFSQFDRIIEECILKELSLAETIAQIFSGTKIEIRRFNDDISQLSRKLTLDFQGTCHMYAKNMTWKNIFMKEQKVLKKPVEEWKQQRHQLFNYFMNMTSRMTQRVCEQQVEWFIRKILETFNDRVSRIKKAMITKEIEIFRQNVTREKVQRLADHRIFKVGAEREKMIYYIENPKKVLQQQVQKAIKQSVTQLYRQIKKQVYHVRVYNEINTQISQVAQKIESVYRIQEKQGLFQSFFKIQSKVEQSFDACLDQKSKIVFMRYFINNLLNKKQQSYDCQTFTAHIKEDRKEVQFNTTFTQQVRQYFESIEEDDLPMTNIVIFITKLSKRFPEIKKEFLQKMVFTQEEIERCFISKVKISFCSQKCPCCERICGLDGHHNGPHQCVYGHQIRAFAGTKLSNGNASVYRCQDMTDTSKLIYNGRIMTWKQFKDQQAIRGWNFDDLTHKNEAQQKQFLYVWKITGDYFCKKYSMNFVEFNNHVDSETIGNVHFILALDESGSMSDPQKWPQLMITLNQILPNIKTIPNHEQRVKISVLLLSEQCKIHQQGLSPNNTDFNSIVPSWGGTTFGPTFDTAYSLMDKYHENSNIMFILLTDGEAEFPATQISQIKQLKQSSQNKIYYSGIEFQVTGTVMSDIHRQLDGKNYSASTQNELLVAFTSAIEIMNTE